MENQMSNLDRLRLTIKGIDLLDTELEVYLEENGLSPHTQYNPTSNTNKKNILKTALSILEDVANNIDLMRNFKMEDMTISQFSENLQNRIDALDRKIRMIKDDNDSYSDGASFTYMFTD